MNTTVVVVTPPLESVTVTESGMAPKKSLGGVPDNTPPGLSVSQVGSPVATHV